MGGEDRVEHKSVGGVNPMLEIVFFVRVEWRGAASGESIWSLELSGGDVAEDEGEEEDSGNPTVDSRIGLEVGVVEHAFDVAGVDFDDKIADSDEQSFAGFQSAVEVIDFEFSL